MHNETEQTSLKKKKNIKEGATLLVTGGVGYIGSHTVLELLSNGYKVVIIDNLCNSSLGVLKKICTIMFGNDDLNHPDVRKSLVFYKVDLIHLEAVENIFKLHPEICGVIHTAALKSVAESFKHPLKYYQTNVCGTLNVLTCMEKYNIFNIIYSSSAAVYGNPKEIPIRESSVMQPMSFYGKTKVIVEELLQELQRATPNLWSVVILRYFNLMGAHPAGYLGDNPPDSKNCNLLPLLGQVAFGKIESLSIFGNDYETPDGTAIRDYVHVMDLAEAHLQSLQKFSTCEFCTYNIGSGRGYSVMEILNTFEDTCGRKIPYNIENRRSGDPPILVSDILLAQKELNWNPKKNIADMCGDYWRWLSSNGSIDK